MLSIGIVGLPNVGKSTLFNALTRSKQADAQNYPFCTIEPNIGVVEVPDVRLKQLADISHSQKVVPTAIEFVDIAGLVKGASEGEGLGNKFLSHIREVDAIAHVVRSFQDSNVIHVQNRVDATDDAGIINLELILADWQTVSKRLENTQKKAKGVMAKEFQKELDLLVRVAAHLQTGRLARELEYDEDEAVIMKELCLLTMKPMMYVVNVDELGKDKPVIEQGVPHVYVCARLEAELADLSPDEAIQLMKESGISESGLDQMIRAGYELLDLVTYFTSGEPETRAWTVKRGTKAPDAAGVIHTDFIKGFVKADVVQWKDFVEAGGWSRIKETGKLRLEGKEYVVQDGDTIYFHIAT
ncbi:MAG: redox-regulated ATPase YchF [Candidatus Magasanikbacteria bacterium RIFCSPHIGHO2_02_FULL_47_14]|uniref:Ribosome-binding ATPase YchF n=1 Tax=Candidatus Magasanikbacteria bacterium RIFCSPHIGHO2_02_FULL_47_14 TaxID=1798680 RepID=A0A1F6M4G7_9BACT|nr:MAG: redox-regulated ATPase YchF [Candidatus Magasanikbacteria bacterium RIFCSPHIGHO2_02_FULL_47_14]